MCRAEILIFQIWLQATKQSVFLCIGLNYFLAYWTNHFIEIQQKLRFEIKIFLVIFNAVVIWRYRLTEKKWSWSWSCDFIMVTPMWQPVNPCRRKQFLFDWSSSHASIHDFKSCIVFLNIIHLRVIYIYIFFNEGEKWVYLLRLLKNSHIHKVHTTINPKYINSKSILKLNPLSIFFFSPLINYISGAVCRYY